MASNGFCYKEVNKFFHSAGEKYKNAIAVDVPDSSWKKLSADDDEQIILSHVSENGVFLVRQLSGAENNRFVDFSAIARIYQDRTKGGGTGFDGDIPDEKGVMDEFKGDKSEDKIIQRYFIPAVLELSWPATLKYEDREKRYIRFEIFNDYYVMAFEDDGTLKL